MQKMTDLNGLRYAKLLTYLQIPFCPLTVYGYLVIYILWGLELNSHRHVSKLNRSLNKAYDFLMFVFFGTARGRYSTFKVVHLPCPLFIPESLLHLSMWNC